MKCAALILAGDNPALHQCMLDFGVSFFKTRVCKTMKKPCLEKRENEIYQKGRHNGHYRSINVCFSGGLINRVGMLYIKKNLEPKLFFFFFGTAMNFS